MQGGGSHDRKSIYADRIVEMILETPLFDLDRVVVDTGKSGLTGSPRVARRLNAKLLGFTDVLKAEASFTDETRRLYGAHGQRFVDRLAAGAPLPPRSEA
jgi:hypothetical protein